MHFQWIKQDFVQKIQICTQKIQVFPPCASSSRCFEGHLPDGIPRAGILLEKDATHAVLPVTERTPGNALVLRDAIIKIGFGIIPLGLKKKRE